MALLRDAVFKRPLSIFERIKIEKSKLNLKPLKRITFRFDPFNENAVDVRKLAHWIHEYDVIKTNPKCVLKTEILTDRSDPDITFDLVNGKKIIFKCANLNYMEIFQLINKHITPLAPKEEETLTAAKLQKLVKKR